MWKNGGWYNSRSEVEIDSWLGLAAPNGTPKAVVDKPQASMLQAMNTEEVKQQFANAGVIPLP